jgi:hypothetical protein
MEPMSRAAHKRLVMEDGRDTEVLGRLAHLGMATAAHIAAIAQYPKRTSLRHGAFKGELVPVPSQP